MLKVGITTIYNEVGAANHFSLIKEW
jgi:hypothetical protein